MTETNTTKEYSIDATGKRIGRVATEVAMILMGKNTPQYTANKVADVKVTITGAEKLEITDAKSAQKTYKRYSGYPGGQTVETLAAVRAKKGAGELLRHAIRGMMPANKLRTERLKRLEITE